MASLSYCELIQNQDRSARESDKQRVVRGKKAVNTSKPNFTE